jgi:hypothetical protein
MLLPAGASALAENLWSRVGNVTKMNFSFRAAKVTKILRKTTF